MNKKSKLRITLQLLVSLFVVYTIGNIFALQYSKKNILAEADTIAKLNMDKILLETDRLLTESETSAHNFRALLDEKNIENLNVRRLLHSFLQANPHLMGVAVAFEPDYLAQHRNMEPALFVYGNSTEGYRIMRLDSLYEYQKAEWYLHTKTVNACNWGNPMRASDGTLISPYCVPLHSRDGRFVGVLAADVSLEGLSTKMKSAAPYPDAIVSLLDRDFHFIAHPNQDYVLKMTLDSLYKISEVNTNESIFIDMKHGKPGVSSYGNGDDEHLVYYAPVAKAHWTVAIDCSYQDIYAPVDNVKLTMIINMLFGMLVFAGVSWRLIKRVEQYEKTSAAKIAMQGELRIAATIQKGMLPKLYPPFPEVKELDVFGILIPAKEVGGDLFDYFIREDKFFFCIGDVSGKGVPASLFMSVLRALFRNVTLNEDRPAAIADSLNTALSEGNEQNMFCTMFLGVLDIKTGHLRYCNCGHNPPVVRHVTDESHVRVCFEEIETNIAVGIFEGFPYKEQEVIMRPGESIFLYTDGVTEAENEDKELYGEERLLRVCTDIHVNNDAASAKDFIERIYKDVMNFSEVGYQSDDITMVVVEYKGRE